MTRKYTRINTCVEMCDQFAKMEDFGCLTRMFIVIDPITKIRECNIYIDDGNGDLIFSFPMN